MTSLKKLLCVLACAAVLPLAGFTPFAVGSAYAQSTTAAQPSVQPAGKPLTGRELYDEAIAVSKLLRDPGAANNTLFESESALSGELKALIYQQLRQGYTRAQILDFMAERYGEAVRYQPDFNASTFLLWAAPWIAVVIGAAVFWRSTRRRKKTAPGA